MLRGARYWLDFCPSIWAKVHSLEWHFRVAVCLPRGAALAMPEGGGPRGRHAVMPRGESGTSALPPWCPVAVASWMRHGTVTQMGRDPPRRALGRRAKAGLGSAAGVCNHNRHHGPRTRARPRPPSGRGAPQHIFETQSHSAAYRRKLQRDSTDFGRVNTGYLRMPRGLALF